MNYIDKLTEVGGGAGGTDLWGSIVRKGFLERTDFELGLGGNLSAECPIIASGSPVDPLLSWSHSCSFTSVCVVIQFATIFPDKILCSVNRLDCNHLCISWASTQWALS